MNHNAPSASDMQGSEQTQSIRSASDAKQELNLAKISTAAFPAWDPTFLATATHVRFVQPQESCLLYRRMRGQHIATVQRALQAAVPTTTIPTVLIAQATMQVLVVYAQRVRLVTSLTTKGPHAPGAAREKHTCLGIQIARACVVVALVSTTPNYH